MHSLFKQLQSHIAEAVAESHENFGHTTIVQPVQLLEEPVTSIYLGHVSEVHYVSTVPCMFGSSSSESQQSHRDLNMIEESVVSGNSHISTSKRKRSSCMREYRKRKKVDERRNLPSKGSKPNDASTKRNRSAYMGEYYCKKKKSSDNNKGKLNENNPSHRCETAKQNSYLDENQNTECPIKIGTTLEKGNNTNQKNVDYFISLFNELVSNGPVYVCSYCDQLWYKHNVSLADKIRKEYRSSAEKYLSNQKSVKNIEWLCRTYHNYLVKNKVPPSSVLNGMQFATKPDFFYLNELESRLLAPRLAFLKLMQAPRGRQFKIHGNVVNVPAEVSETVNMLPRLPSETGTIKVNLKRRLQYKSSALSLNIRPHKVVQAANWLVTNSTLYRQEGITVNQAWGEECTSNFLFDDRIIENETEEPQNIHNSTSNTTKKYMYFL